jgi:hypothetical protein
MNFDVKENACHILDTISVQLSGETKENHGKPRQNSPCPGRDSNRGRPE